MAAISVRGLCMQYGPVRAVDQLAFDVGEGEIFALLGPNGAGKTSTIEILEGYRTRTSGDVQVLGVDPEHGGRRYRERIGIMLQSGGIDGQLTVTETVRLYASFYRRPRPVRDTIALVGLADHAGLRVRALSGGLGRRLDLCLALIGDPEVIFLDEPTTGFDPTARRAAWDMITGLQGLGKTVLLTSHYMDEVEHLADRVAVMRQGRIVAESTPRELGGRDVAETVVRFRVPFIGWQDDFPAGPWRASAHEDALIELTTDQPTQALSILTDWAMERGVELLGLTVTRPSLEDAYLSIADRADQAAEG
jgi:ABC-2 type transport system ATP-binding protein